MADAVVRPAEQSSVVGCGDGPVGGVAYRATAHVVEVVVLSNRVAELPLECHVRRNCFHFASHDNALV